MLSPKEFLKDLTIHPEYQTAIIDWLRPWRLKTYVDILIVVDTEISVSPVNSFGIASVIELLRDTQVGCMRFRVDIALRSDEPFSRLSSPSATQPKYRGFRFNSVHDGDDVIDRYEQIWCFGFKPSNSGSDSDAEIDMAFALPTTNAELEKLDDWMSTKKGGLFGTGDHHFLGASMCRKIPRLGTMRRWTNADGVPPIGNINDPDTGDRIDTLRPPPPVSDYVAGGPLALSNSPHQGDLTVQPIRWTTWRSLYWPFPFRLKKRPHPVLCHPTLGPIDVMPDHAHEGLCVPSPDLGASKQFNSEPEYPDATGGGVKPQPEIIAYGSNLDSDNWRFAKGEQPGRNNNPMIAVYDGHTAGVGRVATDSTWHHWMDVNINNIRAADNNDWKKISRYFINLAVWLNPPGFSTQCFYLSVVVSHFQHVGFQDYHVNASKLELGEVLRNHLKLFYGPCWVTEMIWQIPLELGIYRRRELLDFAERFEDLEVYADHFETLVLGHLVDATLKRAETVRRGASRRIRALPEPKELFAKPYERAVAEFTKTLQAQCKSTSGALAKFNRR